MFLLDITYLFKVTWSSKAMVKMFYFSKSITGQGMIGVNNYALYGFL